MESDLLRPHFDGTAHQLVSHHDTQSTAAYLDSNSTPAHVSLIMPTLLEPPPSDEAGCPSLEDSSFELVSNPAVLSDDEGRTVSIASQSVDGDTTDDFSSVNSNGGYSSEEYDEDEHDEHDDDAALSADHDTLYEPSDPEQPALRIDEIEDSGMTPTPAKPPFLHPGRATEEPYLSDDEELPDPVYGRHYSFTPKRRSHPECLVQSEEIAKETNQLAIPHVLRENIIALKRSRVVQYGLSLPWFWIISLALINISVIYLAASYAAGSRTASRQGLEASASSAVSVVHRANTAPTSWSSTPMRALPTALPVTAATGAKGRATVADMLKRSKADLDKETNDVVRREVEKVEKDMDQALMQILTSALPQKPLGRTVSTDFQEGEGFRLVSYGAENGFLILSSSSMVPKNPPIIVFASRENAPVKFEFTQLRRGVHYVTVAREDAYGTVDFLIKTTNKPLRYQHQRIHLGSSWLSSAVQPLKWADAANKLVNAFRGEVLALEAVTKDLTVQVGSSLYKTSRNFTRGSKKLAGSALQRLDNTAKELIRLPRQSWTKPEERSEEFACASDMAALDNRKQTSTLARRLRSEARLLQKSLEKKYIELMSAFAERLPKADLSLPLKDPAQAIENAKGNARDILARFRVNVGKACGAAETQPQK